MRKGTRKFKKMRVTPPLPICQRCPWEIWCRKLNFRTMNPKGETIKVCPIWWMLIGTLREKGIMKERPTAPPTVPISSEEARIIMETMRRKRREKLGMAA